MGRQRVYKTPDADHILHTIMKLRILCALSDTKMEDLADLVYSLHTGCRILIFCHFIAEIEKVEHTILPMMDVVMKFTGKVKDADRREMIDTFMTPSAQKMALVIQIDCGGVGLNLQIATHVCIMSPSWSAAAEAQAISRAHRMNTPHTVHVHRFLCQDTIEEFIHTRNQDKTETSETLLQDPETEKTFLWDIHTQIFS